MKVFLTGSHRKYLTARKSQRYIWMYMEVIFGLLSMEREPVLDLAALEKERFGEAAEPLYPRNR